MPTVVDARTGSETPLADAPDRTCASYRATRAPIWDGDALWYSVEDHGSVHVHRSGQGCVLGGTRVVTGLDRSGPTTAFLSATPTRGAELHVLDPGGSERRLTHLTDAFHRDVPGPDPIHLAVPSPAGDGDVDTWVLLPPDREGPLPVLLSIHGGPMTQYPTAWFDEFRLWAGAGYAVVWCNPHGSTGHTRAWTRAIRAPEATVDPRTGWGGVDADDVLAALDGALDRFDRLDRGRVGVLGGSYGGFLTSRLVAHTDREGHEMSRAGSPLHRVQRARIILDFFARHLGGDAPTPG